MDYEADLHTCGRPLSESLAVAGSPQPDYVIGEQVCLACQKLEAHLHAKHKDGVPPDRLMRVWTRGEAQAFAKQQAIQQKG